MKAVMLRLTRALSCLGVSIRRPPGGTRDGPESMTTISPSPTHVVPPDGAQQTIAQRSQLRPEVMMQRSERATIALSWPEQHHSMIRMTAAELFAIPFDQPLETILARRSPVDRGVEHREKSAPVVAPFLDLECSQHFRNDLRGSNRLGWVVFLNRQLQSLRSPRCVGNLLEHQPMDLEQFLIPVRPGRAYVFIKVEEAPWFQSFEIARNNFSSDATWCSA